MHGDEIGVVDNRMLRSGRRFAIVGIVALVAVLTPSGDPFTLMVLSVPMYLFYEIAILVGKRLTPIGAGTSPGVAATSGG